jgi:hypothetical protein
MEDSLCLVPWQHDYDLSMVEGRISVILFVHVSLCDLADFFVAQSNITIVVYSTIGDNIVFLRKTPLLFNGHCLQLVFIRIS